MFIGALQAKIFFSKIDYLETCSIEMII